MRFNEGLLSRRRDEFNEKGVRIRFIGRRDWRVPRKVMRAMDEAVALTAANRRLTLTIAFNYGAQCEIVDAVRQIVASGVSPGDVDEALISKHLYDPEMPDVDLWIRTSGEHRISNFLIWQSAYAEMLFLDAYWPEFRRSHMAAAVDEFHGRNRRFGGLDS
jgi:undecaprenyl diphosphate synthase